MEVKFLDLKKQYSLLKSEIDSAVQAVFAEADFIKGGEVERFEKSFAGYCGASHCISCGNGTDALTALLKVHDFPKNSDCRSGHFKWPETCFCRYKRRFYDLTS